MALITPETWLVAFLKNVDNVWDGDLANPQAVKIIAIEEISSDAEITVPSIIYTPTFETTTRTFKGSYGPQHFICDIRGESVRQVTQIRNRCLDALNDPRINDNQVFQDAVPSSAELIDLSSTGAANIFNASFEVSIY